MKKLLIITIALTLSLLNLVACSDIKLVTDVSQNHNISTNPSDLGETQNDMLSDVYTIYHDKDCTTYTVKVMHDSEYNYTIYLYDIEFKQLQTIYLGWCPEGIDFKDVNLDGHMDIVANTGGTVNEMHDLYIWDASSQNFKKVIYEGFEMLSFFEIHEGYIENFIRGDSPESSVMQKLVWDGNTLVKDLKD